MRTRLALAAVATLVVAAASTTPAAIQDPVRIDSGQISGVTLPSGVRAFKGIPFGAPPVGALRWREPQPVPTWDGVRRMEQYGNVCMQNPAPARSPNNVATDLPDSPKMSEDCLYLNVWTGAENASERRPVMVWLYGGAYTEGSGSSPHNDGEALARKGAVVVSFNYRLGAFGFFSHPELNTESGRNASGNQALADAIATLTWVKNNITAFGGDPNNVTIFGESAGAAMVGGLAGSPVARGLFHRAISQSGQWMGLGMGVMQPRTNVERAGAGRAGRGGGRGGGRGAPPDAAAAPAEPPPPPPPLPTLAELRARSTEEVVKTISGSGMIIDGWIIPEDLSITFAEGRQNPVDVISGNNKDEHNALGGNIAFRDTMTWGQRLFAERQAAIGRRAYWYFFTQEPPVEPGRNDPKATHASEIPYAFNNLALPRVFPDQSSPDLAMKSESDRAMADRMSSYWVNFARTGDPNGPGLPPWQPFKDRNAPPHILGTINEYPSADTLNAYDERYAKQLATLMAQRKQ